MRKKKNRPNSLVAKVIFEIRQPLRHAQIGFILQPNDFENRQIAVKSPHLVILVVILSLKPTQEQSKIANFFTTGSILFDFSLTYPSPSLV